MATKEDVQIARDLYDELRGVTSELKSQENSVSKSRKAFRAFESAAEKFRQNQEEIARLNDKDLKNLQEKVTSQLDIAKNEGKRLATTGELGKLLAEEKANLEVQGKSQQEINATLAEYARIQDDLTDEQKALVAAYFDEYKVIQNINGELEREITRRNAINKSLGVTGNVLTGLKEIGGDFVKAFNLNKVQADMYTFADSMTTVDEETGKVTRPSRWRVLSAGIKSARSALTETLTDPAILVSALIKGFKEVDKANVDFQRSTGQSANNFTSSFAAAGSTAITLADYIKTAGTLTKELGQNAAAIFSPDDIAEAAEMTEAMGMAGKEAANLARLSKINGGNLKAQNEALVAGVNAANKQNKTAVATGDVLKEVANTSEGIAISYAGYPEKLASAATTAKSLGMTLADIDRISSSLLQFQSSIEAEMEAELLTGRQLNLEKARQLALDNDLEGVAKELSNQGITSANFSKMNRIQQEAQAKALGMNRDEMAKMLLQQELANGLSEDALSAAQKQTLEQLKSQEATEKFQKALDGLAQAFAPIVGFLAKILSSKVGLFAIQGIILTIVGAKAIKGATALAGSFSEMKTSLKDMYGDAKSLAKGLKEAFDQGGLLGKMYKGGQFMPGGGRAEAGGERGGGILGLIKDALKGKEEEEGGVVDEVTDKVKDKVKDMVGGGDKIAEAADATKDAAAGGAKQGEGIKDFLKGLGDGLASIGKQAKDVIKGGLALGVVGAILGGSFALAMYLVKDVDPVQMIAFSGALAIFGATAALIGKQGGQVMQGAAALLVMGLALVPAAFAFSLLEGLDTDALIAFSIALPLLALAAAALGASGIAPFILLGAAALAVLGAALIPLAYGMNELANADAEGLVSNLALFAGLAPGLIAVGASLFSIAGGLGAMAVAGLAALPVMAALAGLGTVATGISSIFGGDEEGEEATPANNDTAILAEKLDQMNVTLNAILAKEGTVTLDGTKVGTALTVASSKLQ